MAKVIGEDGAVTWIDKTLLNTGGLNGNGPAVLPVTVWGEKVMGVRIRGEHFLVPTGLYSSQSS